MASPGSALSRDIRDVLESVLENVHLFSKQIKGGTLPVKQRVVDRKAYWITFDEQVKQIASWSTKVAVMFSKPPYPKLEEVSSLTAGLERCVVALVSQLASLSTDEGKTLQKEVSLAVVDILERLHDFLKSLLHSGCSPDAPDRVRQAASVNDTCDKTLRSLSRDNLAAVFRVLLTSLKLLQDAVEEVKQVEEENGFQDMFDMATLQDTLEREENGCHGDDNTEDDGEEDEPLGWTDEEKVFVQPGLQLVKLVPTVVTSLSRDLVQNGRLAVLPCVREMDAMADVVQRLSPQMDEVGTALYAPVDRAQLKEMVKSLAEVLLELIDLWKCSHLAAKQEGSKGSETDRFTQEIVQLLQSFPH